MASIFLSYAREDRDFAKKLAHVLESAGHSVWWDSRIGGGEEFSAEIEAELDRSDIVVVAWSKESVKSRWVRDEAAVGGDRGLLVPVSVDGSLPAMGFRQFHTLDLTGWKGSGRDERTAELLSSVERRLNGKGKATAPTAMAAAKRSPAFPRGRPLWVMVAVLLLLAAAAAALMFQNSRSAQGVAKPTIALLPITTASPDPDLRALASQTRDSLAHTFSQSGLPLRLMNERPADSSSAADFIIAGDISRNGDSVLATVRLDETAHGATVFSHRFEAAGEDVRNLAERIGAQMAGNLANSVTMMVLDRRRPLDPALLADLLQGQDFTAGIENLQAYQNSKRVAANAPDVPIAQVTVAFNTSFVLPDLPRNERAATVAEARAAADRAMALNPGFGDTYATRCYLHSETRFARCEDSLRAGKKVDPDAPWLNTFLSHLLRNVGRFQESVELARLSYNRDVYVPTKIAWMLKSLEFTGANHAARELYEQGIRWWPEFKPMFFRNRLYGLLERGDFEAISKLEEEIGPELHPGYEGSAAVVAAVKERSASGVRKACPDAEDYFQNLVCMSAFAAVGDQDGAYAIADKLYPRRVGKTPEETERIWLEDPEGYAPAAFITSPAAASMRRDTRYIALAQRTGLLAYWRTGRRPDFCREQQPEPICRHFSKRA